MDSSLTFELAQTCLAAILGGVVLGGLLLKTMFPADEPVTAPAEVTV